MLPNLEFRAYVRLTMMRIAFAIAWLVVLIFISDTSTYHIRGITATTFDIAMMLTPWGMIQNLLLTSQSYLRPFYGSAAERFGIFDDPTLRWSIIFFTGISLAMLIYLFRPFMRKRTVGTDPA